MIWLTWRQFRVQAAVLYAALAVLAVMLVLTGAGLQELSTSAGSAFFKEFASDGARMDIYRYGFGAVLVLPAVIGIFWGAPLVARELEAGTHRLVWNQSVTRSRWLATKVGLTGLAAIAATALLTLIVTWWCGPIDTAVNAGQRGEGFVDMARLSPATFIARGIVPIGYAAFAFALGVTAGAVIRRTVPAMAITLAVFVAVQIAVPTFVRPHLASVTQVTPITATNFAGMRAQVGPDGPIGPVREIIVDIRQPGAWITSNVTIDGAGKVAATLPSWVASCVPTPPSLPGARPVRRAPAGGGAACFARLAEAGYRQRVTYTPADRYWALQAYETAIFIGLALALIGFCLWWVRHRLS